MTKDCRNPPNTDAGVWAWMFGDEPPREVAAAMRHRGILTAPEAARDLFEQGAWPSLRELVFDNGLTVPDLRRSVARTLARDGGMPVELDARALALVRHLQGMTPPRSLASLPLCEQALDAAAAGDLARVLRAPPHHDVTSVTAAQALQAFDLSPERFEFGGG